MNTHELIQKIYTMCLDDGGELANAIIATINSTVINSLCASDFLPSECDPIHDDDDASNINEERQALEEAARKEV